MPERHGTLPTPEQTMDEVFLSPRVIDHRAFEEYSAVLKALLSDAASQSRTLLNTSGEVKRLGDQLREATKELQGKVETAVRVVPTLDLRVTKAEQILDRVGVELSTKEASVRELVARETVIDQRLVQDLVRRQIGAVIDAALGDFKKELSERVGEAVRAAAGDVEKLRARVEAQREALDALAQASGTKIEEAARQIEAHTERLRAQADGAGARVVQAAEVKAAQILTRVETRAGEIRAAAEEHLKSAASQAQDGLAKYLDNLPSKIQPLEDRAGLIVTELEKRLTRYRAAADAIAEVLGAADLDRVERVAAAAEDASHRAAAAEKQVVDALARAEKAGELFERADRAVREFEQLRAQAEIARRQLGETVLHATEGIDALDRKFEALGERQKELHAAIGDASGRTQRAALEIGERAKTARAELESVAGPILTNQARQVKQMGDWLAELTLQAGDTGRQLERVLRESRGAPPSPAELRATTPTRRPMTERTA